MLVEPSSASTNIRFAIDGYGSRYIVCLVLRIDALRVPPEVSDSWNFFARSTRSRFALGFAFVHDEGIKLRVTLKDQEQCGSTALTILIIAAISMI